MKTPASPVPAGQPGSPSTGEPVYLAVGLLRKPHGVYGDILLTIYTDFPERIKPGTSLYAGEDKQPLKITRRRTHNDGLLLGFEGISTPEQASKHTGKVAFVTAESRPPLPEGEYYHHQLIGLQVQEENGRALGELKEILETGANDVYIVAKPGGGELLLPAIPQVIRQISLPQALITVHLLPGLMEDEAETDS